MRTPLGVKSRVLRLLPAALLFAGACACPDTQAQAPAGATSAAAVNTKARVVIATDGGAVPFTVELAVTPKQRERGLMFRESLGADEGMLFLFDAQQQLSFWMKNTYIPLDMIFINEAMDIIGIVESAEPLTLTSRRVPGVSRYVLEVKGGTAARLGLRAGQRVRFEGLPKDIVLPEPS
jgi:uncharacterized protein